MRADNLIDENDENLNKAILIAKAILEAGGKALIVGGYARDAALKTLGYVVESKDIDIEIYGLTLDRIKPVLATFGPLNIVGESFAVIKLGEIDISIPRSDSKIKKGHNGFKITGDPSMSIREAARRRDFTMNALALDPLTGKLIDEFGGLEDLKAGILRATDYSLFADDSLRVLRAMQFSGRFGLSIEVQTAELCQKIDLKDLPPRRIGDEWDKLLLRSPRPSVGLEVARKLKIIEKLHPELEALVDCSQEPEWHPEGDVWTHTKMAVDEAANIVRREHLSGNDARVILLATLCHDLGKPSTTAYNQEKQRITSYGHEIAGVEPTIKLLSNWEIDGVSMPDMLKRITPIVREHLYPALNPNPTDAAVRRLARRLQPASIRELVWVAEADHRGRDTLFDGFPQGQRLIEHAAELKVDEKIVPDIVKGRHLIKFGLKPGKQFGIILKKLREAQDEGLFENTEDGLAYLKSKILS